MRCTMSLVTPRWAARRRHDQCVVPSGGGRRVAASTRARSRAVNFHGRRPRWRLVRPSTPSSKNRRRHLAMVGRETSSFVSTARAETPSARSSTILARWTNPAGKALERAISWRSSRSASLGNRYRAPVSSDSQAA